MSTVSRKAASGDVLSMTGAGRARARVPCGPNGVVREVAVELRSVNGRGLSVKTRVPAVLGSIERDLERRIRARLARGTVTAQVEIMRGSGGAAELAVDTERFAAVAAALGQLAEQHGLAAVQVRDVLAVPGVLQGAGDPPELDDSGRAALFEAVDQALDELLAERRAEGAQTVSALDEQIGVLCAARERVGKRAPLVVEEHRERLLARLDEFLAGRGASLEPRETVREVALLADRIDISEELQRLDSHVGWLRTTLDGGGEVGRSLEFRLQEVLREINTIGSKSPDAEIADAVVAMKSAVDKLKEQAANLE